MLRALLPIQPGPDRQKIETCLCKLQAAFPLEHRVERVAQVGCFHGFRLFIVVINRTVIAQHARLIEQEHFRRAFRAVSLCDFLRFIVQIRKIEAAIRMAGYIAERNLTEPSSPSIDISLG